MSFGDQSKRVAIHDLEAIGSQFKKGLTRISGLMPEQGSTGGGQPMGSREFSLAVTNMEQAVMWAKAGIEKA